MRGVIPTRCSPRTGCSRPEEGAFGAHSGRRTRPASRGRTRRRRCQSPQRPFEEIGSDGYVEDDAFDPARPGRDLRSEADRQIPAALSRFRRQDHLHVRARHDGARDPRPSGGALRHRRVAGPDFGRHRRRPGGSGRVAERAARRSLDQRRLSPDRRTDLHRAPDPPFPRVRLLEGPQTRRAGAACDLSCQGRRSRYEGSGGIRSRLLGPEISGDHAELAAQLGSRRALLCFPRKRAPDHLHHEPN